MKTNNNYEAPMAEMIEMQLSAAVLTGSNTSTGSGVTNFSL